MSEKREAPRWARRERAAIQLVFDDQHTERVETEDISAGGFRAVLGHPVPVDSILHVVIELTEAQRRFLLAAEVKWCRPQGDGGHVVGFAMLDARGTDYAAWQAYAVSIADGDE